MQNRIPFNPASLLTKNVLQTGIFLFLSVIFAYLLADGSIIIGIIAIGAIMGISLVVACITNLRFGLVAVIVAAFLVNGIKRIIWMYPEIPVGTVVDLLAAVIFLVVLLKNRSEGKYKIMTNFFSVMIIMFFLYNVLQVINPNIISRSAWLVTIRGQFTAILTYFIAVNVIDSLKTATFFIKLFLFLALAMALYGLYQEFFGWLPFEAQWLASDFKTAQRYFTFGRWRRFSFMPDPMSFGVLMAFTGTMCLVLFFGPFTRKRKIQLGLLTAIMFWAMLYTGTRTAYVLIPAGFVFFALITLKREILIAVGAGLLGLVALIILPTNNPTIFILKTSFMGSKDPSYMVRVRNQALIKPIIRSNPFGAGLGTTGIIGSRFSPNSFLAKFPPDSELVRIAIEQGWIGLAIYLLMLFAALKLGIDGYFICKDPRIKIYYVALLSALFMVIVANYPQEVMQITIQVFFGTTAALFTRMKDFDIYLHPELKESEQEQLPY
jgi:hypothetical protein